MTKKKEEEKQEAQDARECPFLKAGHYASSHNGFEPGATNCTGEKCALWIKNASGGGFCVFVGGMLALDAFLSMMSRPKIVTARPPAGIPPGGKLIKPN